MKIKHMIKCTIIIFICFTLLVFANVELYAENSKSDDLVVLRKALLNQIEYNSEWLDVNGDTKFNIKDLIKMKKHLSSIDEDVNELFYIDITFISGSKQVVQRQYTQICCLPELESPYLYWKIGKNFYNEKSIHNFFFDTIVTAVESKKDVDFPIIDF